MSISLPPGVGGCRATDRSTDSINRLIPGRLSQVGRGLPFLPRDSQGRLPVAWVKYDI